MTNGRRVPSSLWLVGGGVVGVVIGAVAFVGLTQYARSVSTTVAELRRANDTIKYVAGLAALTPLALAVLVDSRAFRRLGHPVGGIADDGSWWQQIIVTLFWPLFVAAVLICGLPTYGYFRAKSVSELRDAGESRRAAVVGLIAGVVAVALWIGAVFVAFYGGVRVLPQTSFVTDPSTDQEAVDWARSRGRDVEVFCDRRQLLHVGESFTCTGHDMSTQQPVRVIGTVADDSGRSDWRFGN